MSLIMLIRRYEGRRRFWKQVRTGPPDDCWPWCGATDASGQGVYAGRPAHEHAYELARGPLPAGAHLEHRCGHVWCVNPNHLEVRGGPAGAAD